MNAPSLSPAATDGFIASHRLVWHAAELPGGSGCARQRNLWIDEASGATVAIVQFDTAWHRPIGFNHRCQQWWLLSGSISFGGRYLGGGTHLALPGGARQPAIAAAAGTQIVLVRESSWFFDQTDWQQPWAHGKIDIREHAAENLDSGDSTRLPAHSSVIAELRRGSPGVWSDDIARALLIEGTARVGEQHAPAPTLFPDGFEDIDTDDSALWLTWRSAE